MKKIMFNDKYLLTQKVLKGRKTQTRRIAYTGNATIIDCGICVEPKNIHLLMVHPLVLRRNNHGMGSKRLYW